MALHPNGYRDYIIYIWHGLNYISKIKISANNFMRFDFVYEEKIILFTIALSYNLV